MWSEQLNPTTTTFSHLPKVRADHLNARELGTTGVKEETRAACLLTNIWGASDFGLRLVLT